MSKKHNKAAKHKRNTTSTQGAPQKTQVPQREYYGVAKRRNTAFAFKAERVGAIAPAGHEQDDDLFYSQYSQYKDLVEPLIPFEWCWRQYYQCDEFAICVDVVADNCSNQYQFAFTGDKKTTESPENKAILVELQDFFSLVNEKNSWRQLAKKVLRSKEITNCAFVEVIRGNRLGKGPGGQWKVTQQPPERLYYIPSPHMRATTLGETEVPVTVMMPRGGEMVPITIYRKFRRFARINPNTQELTWFKEYGDPRTLDNKTGDFMEDGETTANPATEIWFFRDNSEGQVYGIPYWFPVFWDMKGRNEAKFVNFDHLDQGAIPPGFFAISGGKASERTKENFDKLLEEIRSPQMFNRFFWLEVEPEASMDLNAGGPGRTVKIEFVKLRDPQHEDFMFEKYLGNTADAIRRRRRIPPILTGDADNNTFASAYTMMEVAESQTFIPIRGDLDEQVSVDLIWAGFGFYRWHIQTSGSKIGDKETFYRAVGALSRAGALTINNVRELANQLLGTSFTPFEGDLYNEPLSLVSTLATTGMVGYSEKGQRLVFLEAMAAAATQAEEDFTKAASGEMTKSQTRLAAEEGTKHLVDALVHMAELKYSPPDAEEMAFELLPTEEEKAAAEVEAAVNQ
jgi:capsid portal protein